MAQILLYMELTWPTQQQQWGIPRSLIVFHFLTSIRKQISVRTNAAQLSGKFGIHYWSLCLIKKKCIYEPVFLAPLHFRVNSKGTFSAVFPEDFVLS